MSKDLPSAMADTVTELPVCRRPEKPIVSAIQRIYLNDYQIQYEHDAGNYLEPKFLSFSSFLKTFFDSKIFDFLTKQAMAKNRDVKLASSSTSILVFH